MHNHMGRRSAQNPRYQKDAKLGSTRKSAASAKPKRSAGEVATPSKKSSGSKKPTAAQINPDTPEFKRWRKIWLGMLIAAMILSAGSFLFRESNTLATQIALVLAYACIFGAFFIDLTIIRKMRKEWLETGGAAGKAKADKAKAKAGADVEVSGNAKVNGPSLDGGEDNLGTTTASSDEGKAD